MKEGPHGTVTQLTDHLFRHQSGKMIAVLTRIFGMHNLEMIEDVVQESFLRAMQTWTFNQLPDNPLAEKKLITAKLEALAKTKMN
jgi:RNA polymerase sigma-70 factor (ECF subfamily)